MEARSDNSAASLDASPTRPLTCKKLRESRAAVSVLPEFRRVVDPVPGRGLQRYLARQRRLPGGIQGNSPKGVSNMPGRSWRRILLPSARTRIAGLNRPEPAAACECGFNKVITQ